MVVRLVPMPKYPEHEVPRVRVPSPAKPREYPTFHLIARSMKNSAAMPGLMVVV